MKMKRIITALLAVLLAIAPVLLPVSNLIPAARAQSLGADKITRTLFASASRGTTTGSAVDIGGYPGFVSFLSVTAQSGTNPTLDLIIQDSPDNATWFTLITYSQITASTASVVMTPTRAPARYVRAKATVGGSSTPLFTFAVFCVAYKGDIASISTTQGGSASFSGFSFTGANGTVATLTTTCESVTLSTGGATTDTSANLLPANSLILNVTAIVTTTITTATDWKLGDANVAGRFTAANSTLTAGTRDTGSVMWLANTTAANSGPYQVAAAKLRITTTGTPDAGAIRVCVTAITFTAPTS